MLEEIKVVIIGSVGVGKSSLAARFIFNQFNQNMGTTLGASYFQKTHDYGNGKSIKFQFWDTAGQQKFKALAKIYYKDAKAAIVMYDTTARQTFDGMVEWMQELKSSGPKDLVVAIVGNKIDLLDEAISVQEGQQYAQNANAIFKLISVKQDKGIRELFDSLASRVQNQKFNSQKGNTQKLSQNRQKKKAKSGGCC